MKAQNQPPFLFPFSGQAPEAEIHWFCNRAQLACGGLLCWDWSGAAARVLGMDLGEERSRRQEKDGPAQNNLTPLFYFILY